MKLSAEKTEQLKALCFEGKGNKEIAEALGISLSDVYANRSQLGITIGKVKAQKGMVENPEFKALRKELDELNRKARFIKKLFHTVQMVDESISSLTLSDNGNMVVISYNNGARRRGVNIECDSYLAIILDVVGSLR